MTDEVLAPVDAAATVAPVEDASSAAPLVASPVVADATVSTDTPAVEAAPVAKVSPTSLLGEGQGDKPATEADAQSPVAEEAAAEAAQAVEYQEFVLPEGVTVQDPEKMGKFTEMLGKYNAPQELGQELVDLHVATLQREMTAAAEEAIKQYKSQSEVTQREDFNRKINDSLEQTKQVFGNRFDATVQTVGSVMSYGGEYTEGFRKALNDAGLGTNPQVVGFLYKLGVALGEGSAVPAAKPVPQQPPGRAARRYQG